MIEPRVVRVAELLPVQMEVVLTNVAQLTRWARKAGVRRSPVRLRMNLPLLSPEELLTWQRQLEYLYNDCGCSAATVSLLGLILAVSAYAALIGFEQSLWLVALGIAVAAIAALFAGKKFGLAWSRRKLRRQVAELVHLVEGRSTDGSPT